MTLRYFKRLLVVLLLAATSQVYAQKAVPVIDALKAITREFKADFVYDPQVVKKKTTTYNVSNFAGKSLEDVLKGVLYPNDLVFLYVKPNYYTIVEKDRVGEYQAPAKKLNEDNLQATAPANQKVKVSGIVTDANGRLFSVMVVEKGTSNGTMTKEDGSYTLTVSGPNAVLAYSIIGYTTKEEVVGSRTAIDVQLAESTKQLGEVVVTALGVKRDEKALGYAVQSVKGSNMQTVKGVDLGTSLTGQVSGLTVKNSTEFNGAPKLEMRGETPLLVIDGVPYGNMTLRDIPTDDIESINMLKGPTAAALYGARGAAGAVMITTKRGKEDRLTIDVNSNTMFNLGYLAIPEVQTSYGHGLDGKIATDYVWGPKLDIGKTAVQWNPITKQNEEMPLVSSGKDNLKNFMETGLITNNSVSVTKGGQNGFFRAGLNHIYNKGQFPNQKLNILNYTMSGELKAGDKFTLESHMGYTRTTAPQLWGSAYDQQGYIYQILMWTGPDYDIRQYKDYWVKPNVQQNWLYNAWYDNPYLIAYEKTRSTEQNKLNASLVMNYNFTKDLKLMFRNGYDYYKNEDVVQNPAGINSTRGMTIGNTFAFDFSGKGLYGQNQSWGNSINSDLILTYNKQIGKWNIDALGGGSLFYYKQREQGAKTRNGLAVPGWYSLANAVPSTTAGVDGIINTYGTWARQTNSVYGKATLSWNSAVFLDVTGRNDWSSTQAADARSYFYPSVATSVLMSEFIKMPEWIDMWKVRGSWTMTKTPLDVYANNLAYTINNSWGTTSATTPDNLAGSNLLPTTTRTWEFGTAAYLFQKRLHVDVAYFTKLYYNNQIKQTLAPSSGYATTLINTDETYARRGVEITLDGTVMKQGKFQWNSMVNFSTQHRYFVDIDPVYSAKNLWTKSGGRYDVYARTGKALRDPQGNLIHQGGQVQFNPYTQQFGYTDPDFVFGFINNFTYGNWNLGISIDGRIGGVLYDYIYAKMFDTGSNPETDNQWRYDEVVNGLKNYVGNGVKIVSGEVTYDNFGQIKTDTRKYAPNDVPVSYQAYARRLGNSSETGVMSKSFVKVREISLGYKFPQAWFGKSGIKNASVAVTGQNLFLFTKFKYSDPDVDSEDMNAPAQRMVGVNIKVGF
ncbi:TonB-linked outer membrane protein, SusC/RagA family [Chitinophaga jiangningensis]|uniref:TonB-linked outer membrane protein, SusC/RagA family n=1 Tax=Chitinophaga jiangningensis TaxID=1419482 RepID=A0A1M6WZX8_9BACT|nr:SusC/RagA family TonB-linked outer membrane protein [Chitinophaga jiangningensis]SHK99139.1 TonB-linked outer membrane protein, SusC/RagA family [Chitinophaga jiangningensis]